MNLTKTTGKDEVKHLRMCLFKSINRFREMVGFVRYMSESNIFKLPSNKTEKQKILTAGSRLNNKNLKLLQRLVD